IIQTVRLSALESHEAMVQFARDVSMVTGVVNTGRGGPLERSQRVSVGTHVEAMVESHQDRVMLMLRVEGSRVEGEGGEQGLPAMPRFQWNSTLLLQPGTPTLVG